MCPINVNVNHLDQISTRLFPLSPDTKFNNPFSCGSPTFYSLSTFSLYYKSSLLRCNHSKKKMWPIVIRLICRACRSSMPKSFISLQPDALAGFPRSDPGNRLPRTARGGGGGGGDSHHASARNAHCGGSQNRRIY